MKIIKYVIYTEIINKISKTILMCILIYDTNIFYYLCFIL